MTSLNAPMPAAPVNPTVPGAVKMVRIKAINQAVTGAFPCPPGMFPKFTQEERYVTPEGEIKVRERGFISFRLDVPHKRPAIPPEIAMTDEERKKAGFLLAEKEQGVQMIIELPDPETAVVPEDYALKLINRPDTRDSSGNIIVNPPLVEIVERNVTV